MIITRILDFILLKLCRRLSYHATDIQQRGGVSLLIAPYYDYLRTFEFVQYLPTVFEMCHNNFMVLVAPLVLYFAMLSLHIA